MDIDFSLPLMMNITCLDSCILCGIGYKEEDKIQIHRCCMNLCEKHFQMATKGCIPNSYMTTERIDGYNNYCTN